MTSIFVAKLDFGVDNQQLSTLFETYGKVNKASVALDRETGKSRGFGFVEMPNDGEAQEAIKNLDGSEVNGRPIAVKQAEDRTNSRPNPRPTGDSPRRDSRPSDTESTFSRPFSRPTSEDAPAPFVPEIKKEVRTKVPKAPMRENEGPKAKKMEAYRKSGKDNVYLDDDDDFNDEIDLFGRDEDEELDEDYSKYLVNASDDDEDEYEDDDFEDDEEYED
jgi:RNA recognition motif-containing protein